MGKLRVLTYNVKMLPDIGRIGAGWEKVVPDSKRAKRIVNALSKNPWDILCLQEVFDEDRRADFVDLLGKNGLGYSAFVSKSHDGDPFHEDSGLFLASRFPIAFSHFQEFTHAAGSDQLSDKGVLAAVIKTKPVLGVDLALFMTHMQSGEAHAGVRASQILQFSRFARKTLNRLKEPKNYAVLYGGDFNVIGEAIDTDGTVIGPTSEYSLLKGALCGARDLYREQHGGAAQKHGATWDPPANPIMTGVPNGEKENSGLERLDYLFSLNALPPGKSRGSWTRFATLNANVTIERFPDEELKYLSDHYALSAELELAKKR